MDYMPEHALIALGHKQDSGGAQDDLVHRFHRSAGAGFLHDPDVHPTLREQRAAPAPRKGLRAIVRGWVASLT